MAKKSYTFWKVLRIFILLLILFLVWQNANTQKTLTTTWDVPLSVIYYPINADGKTSTTQYLETLELKDLNEINRHLLREAQRFGIKLDTAVEIRLDKSITEVPDQLPVNGSFLTNAWWSLKFRYWANKHKPDDLKVWQIRLYALYFTPEDNMRLPHSTGLEKGLFALINLFASEEQEKLNNVVSSHELLHTLGATDKYNLSTGQPIYPQGYAEPNKKPLHPQSKSEIMAILKATSATETELPTSLNEVIVSDLTAREIGWIKD